MSSSPAGAGARAKALLGTEVRPDGVAIFTLDDPGEAHNTITPALGAELQIALDATMSDPSVKAIVLRSGKRDSFLVGANISFIQTIKFAKDAEDVSREVGKRFARLDGKKPVVACVHGAALGGGFELALACTATIATDDAKTVLGLPEVKLGLMPAANGLLRVASRAGLRVAIDLGLTGRSLRATRALSLGLVDDVVAPPIALETACALALRIAGDADARRALARRRAKASRVGMRGLQRALVEDNPVGRALLFRRARAEAARKTRGHYPASDRILDVLERYGARGFRSAAELEARLFGDLVVSETSHRLVEVFFAHTAVKKDPGVEPSEVARARPHPVERVAVLGAGLMGAGIACASVQAGLSVRMKDTDDAALGRGLKYVRDVLQERARRGSITALERDRIFSRLSGTLDHSGVASADLVVEAVFEDIALKHAVIRDVEKLVKDTCVIASNTSSLPIAQIADAATHPERVVGMHYFSPVHEMPLLEVVRTQLSDPRTIATAVSVGKRQGKTVIVVRDGAGFYTTRILVPYLNEAARILAEGVPVDAIDDAMVDWGFPTGPLQLLDDVGIDVASHVMVVMQRAFGERMRAPEALAGLRRDDRKGRKNGRGFYLYGRGRREERRVDDTVYAAIGAPALTRPKAEEISLRCTTVLVNEALRCLDEGILRSPRDGDVGAIFGLGFPAFRGGPLRYVDVIGAPEILTRTRALEQRHGPRFEPAPLLVEMARKGKRFY